MNTTRIALATAVFAALAASSQVALADPYFQPEYAPARGQAQAKAVTAVQAQARQAAQLSREAVRQDMLRAQAEGRLAIDPVNYPTLPAFVAQKTRQDVRTELLAAIASGEHARSLRSYDDPSLVPADSRRDGATRLAGQPAAAR